MNNKDIKLLPTNCSYGTKLAWCRRSNEVL